MLLGCLGGLNSALWDGSHASGGSKTMILFLKKIMPKQHQNANVKNRACAGLAWRGMPLNWQSRSTSHAREQFSYVELLFWGPYFLFLGLLFHNFGVFFQKEDKRVDEN